MSCTPPVRTLQSQTITVFSVGGTSPGTSDIFVMSTEESQSIAPMLAGLRVTVIIENATADFKSQAVFQATNDGCSRDAAVPIEASPVGDNRKTTTPRYTDTSNFKRGIRVGVLASQEAGVNTMQAGRAKLVIDYLLRS